MDDSSVEARGPAALTLLSCRRIRMTWSMLFTLWSPSRYLYLRYWKRSSLLKCTHSASSSGRARDWLNPHQYQTACTLCHLLQTREGFSSVGRMGRIG